MGVNDDIRLVKGSYDITLFTATPTENWKNNLEVIPPVTSVNNQDEAPNKSQVVDLQRTNFSYVFECFITSQESPSKTAFAIKEELRVMFEGAREEGGPIVITYEDKSINVFFEDCVIKKATNDDVTNSGYTGNDSVEYSATLTFVEGEAA